MLEARVHALGTYGLVTETWRWAWANDTIREPLRARADAVRVLGAAQGERWLVEPVLPIGATDARRLAAAATSLLRLPAFYAAPYDNGVLFVAIEDAHAIDTRTVVDDG